MIEKMKSELNSDHKDLQNPALGELSGIVESVVFDENKQRFKNNLRYKKARLINVRTQIRKSVRRKPSYIPPNNGKARYSPISHERTPQHDTHTCTYAGNKLSAFMCVRPHHALGTVLSGLGASLGMPPLGFRWELSSLWD